MNSWLVPLALIFVVGFLVAVAISAWRIRRETPMASWIRSAAARFVGMSAAPIPRGDELQLPRGGQRPGAELGSWVVATAAFMLVAFPQTDALPFIPLGLSPARFILFAGACLWLVTRLTGQRSKYRLGALGPVLAIWAVSLLTAYGAQMTKPVTAPNLDQIVIRELMMIIVVLFCFTVIHSYAGLTRVIKGLVAGAVVSSVAAIIGSVTGPEAAPRLRLPGLVNGAPLYFTDDDLFREGMMRAQGSASHPLELACVLTVTFALGLGLTLSLRAAGKRWWPWALATAVMVVGISVSLSRSGMVGVVVVFAVMACYWPLRRTVAILAVACGVLAVGSMLQIPMITGYLSIFGADRSVEQRAAVTSALPFDISPLGTLGIAAGRQVPRNPAGEIPTLDDQYLKVLAEQGVVGLLAYLALVVTTIVLAFMAYRNVRKKRNARLPEGVAPMFLAIAAAVSAYSAVTFFLDAAGFLQIWTTMWMMVAISAVALRLSRRPDDGVPSPTDRQARQPGVVLTN